MTQQKHKKKYNLHKNNKKNSAVTFDYQERQNYLKGMIGAKKRRREFYQKKVEQELKESKKQERADYKAQRREELQKARELVEKLIEKA